MRNKIVTIYLSFLLILAVLNIFALNIFYDKYTQLEQLRDDRFIMLTTGDELRQSSDDLSRFAKTYVVTGDEEYKDNYYAILDIRDGLLERPYYYEGIYWDLLEPIRSQRHRPNNKEVFEDKITELPYEDNELKMLQKAKDLSDKLVSLEEEAFYAMQGKFKDENGEYNIEKSIDQTLAIKLLHSERYHIEKAKVVLPIDNFIFLLTKRTSLEIHDLQKIVDSSFFIFIFSFIVFLLSIISFIYFDRKNIKNAFIEE